MRAWRRPATVIVAAAARTLLSRLPVGTDRPAAMAWLWKDHTGVAEAAEITELARQIQKLRQQQEAPR